MKQVDNKLVIQLQDHSMMVILCEPSIRHELKEYFSFYVEGYKFMPAYKRGAWDGKIRLFNSMTCEINVGLFRKVLKFAMDRAYLVEVKASKYGRPGQKNELDQEKLSEFITSLKLPFEPMDYQFESVAHSIENKRCVMESPTGSGKSLIIYILTRWYLENHNNKILIVVPTTGLVEQMFQNFEEDYKWTDAEKNCHRIYSGKEKISDKRIYITTWQSVHRLKKDWFLQFGCVIGDEAHQFKAKCISSIMNKSTNASYRYGTTGSLDKSETNQLVLEGLFGPIKKVTKTKRLQERKILAGLDIDILMLQYPEAVRREFGDKTYQEEIDFIVSHEARNKFIRNLAVKQKGNTLVLFRYVEKHGQILYNMIKEKCNKAYYVHADIATSDREAIRKIVDKQDGAIIVASMGTFSTGINIKNIHNIIFASPTKAQIGVLQSIGRGLRQSDDGRNTKLFDIADDLHWDQRSNYTLNHCRERVKIYKSQEWEFNLHKVKV